MNEVPEATLLPDRDPQPVGGLRVRLTPLPAGSFETVGVIGSELFASMFFVPSGDRLTEIPGCTVMLSVAFWLGSATDARTRAAEQADCAAL